MTINEIENTLLTLCKRHPNLTEESLRTLLASGGWEDKVIRDAVSLFTSHRNTFVGLHSSAPTKETMPHIQEAVSVYKKSDIDIPSVVVSQNTNQGSSEHIVYFDGKGEEEVIPVVSENSVDVPKEEKKIVSSVVVNIPPQITPVPQAHIETVEVPNVPEVKPITASDIQNVEADHVEPQSLILPAITPAQRVVLPEIPPNLPMKPFESTSHVWPFSKYKETFHRDTTATIDQVRTTTQPVPTQTTSNQPPRSLENTSVYIPPQQRTKKRTVVKRSGFDGEDEGLIFLTGSMLFIIIMLLAYMYANGRL